LTKKGTHNYVNDSRNEHIKIYINGTIISRENARISVFDSGFLLGDGVWEGIRLHNGHLCFADEHFDRLINGAKQLKINIGKTKTELINIVKSTLRANKMNSGVHIRLIITRGLKRTPYQHPNANVGGSTIVCIPEYKIADTNIIKKGISLCTVETVRGFQNSQDPRLNSLSKLNCIAACLEADEKGADEGVMLDPHGFVSTCNSTNLFIVKKGEVWTSTGDYCLPGITRGNIIKICIENEVAIYQKNYTINELLEADEIFVTGTFSGVIPVKSVNDKIINNSQSENLTSKLFKLYKLKIEEQYTNE
jgi:branched-chain amino acid aminotransferase